MTSTAPIATIRSAHRRKFIAHKMFTACAAMAAFAINPNLVNKIAFFQMITFEMGCKYTLSLT